MNYDNIINELLEDVKELTNIQEQLINVNINLAIKLNHQINNLLAIIQQMQRETK